MNLVLLKLLSFGSTVILSFFVSFSATADGISANKDSISINKNVTSDTTQNNLQTSLEEWIQSEVTKDRSIKIVELQDAIINDINKKVESTQVKVRTNLNYSVSIQEI